MQVSNVNKIQHVCALFKKAGLYCTQVHVPAY